MFDRPTMIERAFELAGTGRFKTPTQIANVLRRERYDVIYATFAGEGFRRQLKGMMRAAKRSGRDEAEMGAS